MLSVTGVCFSYAAPDEALTFCSQAAIRSDSLDELERELCEVLSIAVLLQEAKSVVAFERPGKP